VYPPTIRRAARTFVDMEDWIDTRMNSKNAVLGSKLEHCIIGEVCAMVPFSS
jgi:hypothetical protein